MTDQQEKKFITQRSTTNIMLTAFLYPYTMIPFTPLMGIYRTGKETYNVLKNTPLGNNEVVHFVATCVATPILSVPLFAPLGVLQGVEFLSDKVDEYGIDKGFESTVKFASDTVLGSIGKTLEKAAGSPK